MLLSPLFRSPGATLKFSRPLSPEQVYYIAIENQPAIAEQLYAPPSGQVFLAEDTSRGDVWNAVVLSGDNVGDSVLVQRNTIEEYCASVAVEPMKKLYNVVNHISRCVHGTTYAVTRGSCVRNLIRYS